MDLLTPYQSECFEVANLPVVLDYHGLETADHLLLAAQFSLLFVQFSSQCQVRVIEARESVKLFAHVPVGHVEADVLILEHGIGLAEGANLEREGEEDDGEDADKHV